MMEMSTPGIFMQSSVKGSRAERVATTMLSSLASWKACKDWFQAEKVLNHDRHCIPHGSVVKNNWHREGGWDNFLLTVDRAAAFI
jgi:hypothetical protein